jgi:hypothetical protein
MATRAPRPGSARAQSVDEREQAAKAAKTLIRMRVQDKELTFSPRLSIAERGQVRKQATRPWSEYWNDLDEDSLPVIWWMARRANGEPNLLLRTVEEAWPVDLIPDDIDIQEISPDDDEVADHPE